VWNALDTEKSKGAGTPSTSPEPMRWKRDSEASAASSRAATPSGLAAAAAAGAAAEATGGSTGGSAGARGPRQPVATRRLTSPESEWSPLGPVGVDPVAAGPTGGQADAEGPGSTGSSPRGNSFKDRAKLVREYVKLRSTPATTPQSSLRGDSSYLRERISYASDGGIGGASSSSGVAGAAGAGAGTAASLWRPRSPALSDLSSQAEPSSSMQPSPLMGGGLQPSPLMGGGMQPSPLMGGLLPASPSRGVRFSDSSMPPSPMMPESPTHTGRVSDASGAEMGGSVSSYPGTSGVRLSSLVAAESRMRRKPSGSAASSPRAPVGIAETEFRRRGSAASPAPSVAEERAEIEADLARDDSTGRGQRPAASSMPGRIMSYKEASAAGAPGAAATAAGGAYSSSSSGGALGGAARAGTVKASKPGTTAAGTSAGGAAGATAAGAGAAAVSGRPGFLGSLFGE